MSSEASCVWSGLAAHLGSVEKSLRARGNGRGVHEARNGRGRTHHRTRCPSREGSSRQTNVD